MPAARTPRSVWLRPERSSRDRQLSRPLIVSAAIALLDEEGTGALSMRRVASRLGVTAGSLYWYVATKDELLELAADQVTGEIEAPPAGAGWRAALTAIAASQRSMLLRHPWVMAALGSQPGMGPNALRVSEQTLRILDGAGFDGETAAAALAAIGNQVTGSVVAETAWRRVTQGPSGTLADWQREASGYLAEIARQYPLVAARLAGPPPDIGAASQARFALALDCLLDGLETRLPGR